MRPAELRNYPVRVSTSFSNDRNSLIYGILKHACVKRRASPTGAAILQFRDQTKDYDEGTLRAEMGNLSTDTLRVVVAAFMRNTDPLNHGFIVRIVRCYVEARPRSKRVAEAILYYAARLSNVLINFSKKEDKQYEKCISIVADIVSSAHLFQGADDKQFRSGSFYAERSMKGMAAWFCLGRDKVWDTDTLYFLSKNLELLTPHADAIRKHQVFDVALLQEFANLSSVTAKEVSSIEDDLKALEETPLESLPC